MFVFVIENRMGQPRKIGDPLFGPCADDYPYALHTRHETPIVLQAAICPWKTGTALKPRLLRQVGKTQSVLSAEDSKQPIAVIKEKETHMVLWFGCSVDCEPVLSTEWGIGKYLKRKHGDSFISFILKHINRCAKHIRLSELDWRKFHNCWSGASWNYV